MQHLGEGAEFGGGVGEVVRQVESVVLLVLLGLLAALPAFGRSMAVTDNGHAR
ncbi:hypothetical protein AB0I49_30940 [Streptomyces sp. NPDC050617]|uniref:hypothetical protein n=1 Tax=Streptomyces sp. NPDC050617 TaxID=3154628 RepID=UPI00341D9047